MKKIIIAMVILILSINVTACNKDNKNIEDDKLKISLILDEGGVNDQSFNQSAWEGALKAKDEYGVDVSYIESKQESDYLSNVETAIDMDSDLVIGVGFKLTDTIKEAAIAYPNQQFAIIDGTYEDIPNNVQPILFNEEEAGYSVGLIASQITKTNVVGFVGGMDIPSVSNFLVGFEKALKEVNSEIKILSQYANSFTDAAKGRTIAEQMIQQGSDILFTCGGVVNTGVFESARENNINAIGVDMPSNYIAPDVIITSALKNVGRGVELTVQDLVNGEFKGGQVKMFDLSNGGVGYEDTKHLTNEIKTFVDSKTSK